jgi:hypothetical protein
MCRAPGVSPLIESALVASSRTAGPPNTYEEAVNQAAFTSMAGPREASQALRLMCSRSAVNRPPACAQCQPIIFEPPQLADTSCEIRGQCNGPN